MAEQSWRNPRSVPTLTELRDRTPAPRSWRFLRAWWPAIAWAAVIFSLSTDSFSAANTGSILSPILHWLYPPVTEGQFELIHHLIRKSAHFTEYFVFYLFIYRGVRGGATGWRWTWGLTAWFVAAIYSVLDEIHQSFVASRTASPYDSLLDSIGAFFAVLILFLWFRFRASKSEPLAER